MKTRKKIQFKVNGKLIVEEINNLFLNQVDEMKWVVADECKCHIDEVSVNVVDLPHEWSEIDVTFEGMMDWKNTEGKIISGVKLNLVIGSDEHLDALNNGTLENYLIFI